MKRLVLRLRHNKGFTLIELLMTIVVVGIVAVPLSLMLSRHIESAFASTDYTTAVNLARFEMEKMNNADYADIGSDNFSNYEGYDYDVTRVVTYAQGNAASQESLKKITVEVKKSGSAISLISLVTYIAKNIRYGV